MPAPLDTGFAVPTLPEVQARVMGDLATLPGAAALTPGSDAWLLAQVVAGQSYLQQGGNAANLRELHVLTATATNLPRIGAMYGVIRNLPSASRYLIEVEATDATTIPAETLLTSVDGVEFLTDEELVFAAPGTGNVGVTCQEAGTAGNLEVAALLTFAVALPDVESTAAVVTETAAGADDEDLEIYRTRILARIHDPADAGTLADYEAWALEVDGTVRAWALKPADGSVLVVVDPTGKAAEVQTYVDSVRNISGQFTAAGAVEQGVAMSITGTPAPGAVKATVKAAIEAAVNALYASDGAPGGTIYNSAVRRAIDGAEGLVQGWTMPSYNGVAGGLADYTSTSPAIPIVGTITWGGGLA